MVETQSGKHSMSYDNPFIQWWKSIHAQQDIGCLLQSKRWVIGTIALLLIYTRANDDAVTIMKPSSQDVPWEGLFPPLGK